MFEYVLQLKLAEDGLGSADYEIRVVWKEWKQITIYMSALSFSRVDHLFNLNP